MNEVLLLRHVNISKSIVEAVQHASISSIVLFRKTTNKSLLRGFSAQLKQLSV